MHRGQDSHTRRKGRPVYRCPGDMSQLAMLRYTGDRRVCDGRKQLPYPGLQSPKRRTGLVPGGRPITAPGPRADVSRDDDLRSRDQRHRRSQFLGAARRPTNLGQNARYPADRSPAGTGSHYRVVQGLERAGHPLVPRRYAALRSRGRADFGVPIGGRKRAVHRSDCDVWIAPAAQAPRDTSRPARQWTEGPALTETAVSNRPAQRQMRRCSGAGWGQEGGLPTSGTLAPVGFGTRTVRLLRGGGQCSKEVHHHLQPPPRHQEKHRSRSKRAWTAVPGPSEFGLSNLLNGVTVTAREALRVQGGL